MATKFNLFFVPHFNERKRISPLRLKICKLVHSNQALQNPVHVSLISSGFNARDYAAFENELRGFCRHEKPFAIKAEGFTSVLPDRFWTGIHISRTEKLARFQKKLQDLRNKHATKKEKHIFRPPHITLAFPAKVDGLKKFKNPVVSMEFDRITIVRKEEELGKYRIFKHVKIG